MRGRDQAWVELRIGVRRYRRLLRAAFVAVAIVVIVARLSPKPAPTTTIVAAARDLPAGEVLTPADLSTVALPPVDVPSGTATDMTAVVGNQLSSPLRRGEPLTDVRLTGGVLRRPAIGFVSAPVRLVDSQAARLLQPGQRIDVLASSTTVGDATTTGGPKITDGGTASGTALGSATVVAADVMVVAIPVAAAPSAGGAQVDSDVGVEGALVVLATSPLQARQLAQAQVTSRLSAVVVG